MICFNWYRRRSEHNNALRSLDLMLPLYKEVSVEVSPGLKLSEVQTDSCREKNRGEYPAQVDIHLDKCISLQMPSLTRRLIAKLVNTRAAGCDKRIYLLYMRQVRVLLIVL